MCDTVDNTPVTKRDAFIADGGLWEAIAAALPQEPAAEDSRLERHAAHERHGAVPGRPCGDCGKIHVHIGDRVSRHPSTWTCGDQDGGPGNFGTVKEDDEGSGVVLVAWDAGTVASYPWGPHGSSEVVHVAFAQIPPALQPLVDATGLPCHLAGALLSAYGGNTDLAVNKFFEGEAPAEVLERHFPPMREGWRARVLPDVPRLQAAVKAHGQLQWSNVRQENVGRECFILRLDLEDQTAQVEHYDGSSSWWPLSALHGVRDPTMEAQEPLRFGVGDRVLCNMGDHGWMPGTVDAVWCRQRGWKRRKTAPYSIVLDGDIGSVTAPYDKDSTIRAEKE